MISTGGPNIFVASMWRSGSTHLSRVLADSLGWRPATTAGMHGEGMEQQVINHVSAAILFPYGHQVFQQHTMGTPRNILLLKGFNIKPIIMVRNIYDIIVSLRDHVLNTEIYKIPGHHLEPTIPGLIFPSKFDTFSERDQYLWLAHNATPWLLQFYVSWHKSDIDKMLVRYEQFFSDQIGHYKRILAWLEIDPPEDSKLEAFAGHNYNKRNGTSGRGQRLPLESLNIIMDQGVSWGEEWYERFCLDGIL